MKPMNTFLQEAIELFKKEGISHFSDEELCQRLNISESDLKRNFKDRGDLIWQALMLEYQLNRERDQALRKSTPNPVECLLILITRGVEDLKNINGKYISDLVKDYPEILKEQRQTTYQYSYDLIYGILKEGVEEGLLKGSMNKDIVSKVMIQNVNLLIDQENFPPEKYQVNEIFRCIYLYYVRGLCTERSLPMAEQYFAYIV